MNTTCAPSDECVMKVERCSGEDEPLHLTDQTEAKRKVLAHELGHALNMYHSYDLVELLDCGTIKHKVRHPFPTGWTDTEKKMIRLHENF